jgi:predicted unusual protein kinase regulating ubiquinone biosynthesis (AarF/ABC1/UbiB family)
MIRRAWLFVTRFVIVVTALLPIWVGYVVPFLRWRRGATIPPEKWKRLHEKHAPRFYRIAVRMRGGLIKVGQILSTRVDLLPIEWTSTLSGLQDRVDPLPWLELEPHVRRAYGRSPKEVFDSIDEKPTAAASFGQVHRAITPQREVVALKIRYPDAVAKLGVDLWSLQFLLPLFNVFLPSVRLRPIYDEVRRALETELDYEEEARFTQLIHENFEGHVADGDDRQRIHVPRVLSEYTRTEVICTTWFEGKKIIDPIFLSDPRLDRRALLELVIDAWIQMMYVDGVFQSDPHPGNLLARIADDGKPEICIVDFGQVKILTRAFHQTLVRSVMAFVTRDVDGFAATLSELGLFGPEHIEKLRPLLVKILDRYSAMTPEETQTMDFTWVRDEVLSQLAQFRGITIPQELVLYGRTFALLAGLTRSIDPTVDAFALAKPHFLRAMLAGGPPE